MRLDGVNLDGVHIVIVVWIQGLVFPKARYAESLPRVFTDPESPEIGILDRLSCCDLILFHPRMLQWIITQDGLVCNTAKRIGCPHQSRPRPSGCMAFQQLCNYIVSESKLSMCHIEPLTTQSSSCTEIPHASSGASKDDVDIAYRHNCALTSLCD